MRKFKFIIIVFFILMTCSISNANDLIKISSFENKAFFVSKSDIRQNLTNYRNGGTIMITIMIVFLTKEESQKYMKDNPCWRNNGNDYKYILEYYRFSFEELKGMTTSRDAYDKFGQHLCEDDRFGAIKMKDNPTFIKLKKIFNDADREEKKEPW